MEKQKLDQSLLLRMDKDTKSKLTKLAEKLDRSLNWVILNLIKKESEKEGV